MPLPDRKRYVAATKSYTAELAVVALLSVALEDRAGAQLAAVEAVASDMEKMPALEAEVGIAERYRYTTRVVLGRGYNYATACRRPSSSRS